MGQYNHRSGEDQDRAGHQQKHRSGLTRILSREMGCSCDSGEDQEQFADGICCPVKIQRVDSRHHFECCSDKDQRGRHLQNCGTRFARVLAGEFAGDHQSTEHGKDTGEGAHAALRFSNVEFGDVLEAAYQEFQRNNDCQNRGGRAKLDTLAGRRDQRERRHRAK